MSQRRRRRPVLPQDHPAHGRLLQVLEVADGEGSAWRVRLYLDLRQAQRVILRALYSRDGITRAAGGGIIVVARRILADSTEETERDHHGDGDEGG